MVNTSKNGTATWSSQRCWQFARSIIITATIAVLAATIVCAADTAAPSNVPGYTLTLDVGLTEPLAPDITHNIILKVKTEQASGEITWQYRKQNAVEWTRVAASGAVASVTFPGAPVAQVFEVQAIGAGITTSKMIKVASTLGEPNQQVDGYLGIRLLSSTLAADSIGYTNDHDETAKKYARFNQALGTQTLIYSLGITPATVTGLRVPLDLAAGMTDNVTYWVGDGATWSLIATDSGPWGTKTREFLPNIVPVSGTQFKVIIPSTTDVGRGYRVKEFCLNGTGAPQLGQPEQLTTDSTPPVAISPKSSDYVNSFSAKNPEFLPKWLTTGAAPANGFKAVGNDVIIDLGKLYHVTSMQIIADLGFSSSVSIASVDTGPWATVVVTDKESMGKTPLLVGYLGECRYIKLSVTDGGAWPKNNFPSCKIWGTPLP